MGRMTVTTLLATGLAAAASAAPPAAPEPPRTEPIVSVGNSSSNGSSNSSGGITTHRWTHSETRGGRTRVWRSEQVIREGMRPRRFGPFRMPRFDDDD